MNVLSALLHKCTWSVITILVSIIATGMPQGGYAANKAYSICIRNYTKVHLSESEVDDILVRATGILKDQKTASCQGVSLSRQGLLKAYDGEYPATLATSSDFAKFKKDPCLKVVERISWCGDVTLPDGGALGCAPVPGQGMVAVRTYEGKDETWDKGVEPITWLHEFGHTLGLDHNSADDMDVMTSGIDLNTRRIALVECTVYSGKRAAVAAVPGGGKKKAAPSSPKILPAQGGAVDDATAMPPVEEFVKKTTTSFPVKRIQKYYAKESKKIEQLLVDPHYDRYRSKLIALLGVVGTPDSLPIMKKIIETPFGPRPSEVDVRVRLAALIAVGAIANRYKLPEADFQFIEVAKSQGYWKERLAPATVSQVSPSVKTQTSLPANGLQTRPVALDAADVQNLTHDLQAGAYKAWALTGSPEVGQKLQQEQKANAQAAIPAGTKESNDALLKDSIILHNAVILKGALGTYSTQ